MKCSVDSNQKKEDETKIISTIKCTRCNDTGAYQKIANDLLISTNAKKRKQKSITKKNEDGSTIYLSGTTKMIVLPNNYEYATHVSTLEESRMNIISIDKYATHMPTLRKSRLNIVSIEDSVYPPR
ncbi:hypothetical protein NGRA_2980 [Nosema granulosis]|uniref:Uncharacterized protein n=1 Tax=Nosema granulosis TaxID=83296 RepID=A0A9P6KXX8_9MICR|nr:hypothetical protein NGRA_2980 [Nosema granulosis]